MDIKSSNSPVVFNICKIINEKGLKQNYVAKKAGYSERDFNSFLNGRRLLKAYDISQIVQALDVFPNDLFNPDNSKL